MPSHVYDQNVPQKGTLLQLIDELHHDPLQHQSE